MWLRGAVMSHACLSWFNFVTVWCSYESYVLALIWLCDCEMQLWVMCACPDLTMWLCDAVMSHSRLSWFDYVTRWCSYESYVLALIWLCDCVVQLWVMRACPDSTLWLCDAVMSHMCLSWFDYVTAWCTSSQSPTFHPCCQVIESLLAQWLEHLTRSRRLVGSNPIWDLEFFPNFYLMQTMYHVLLLQKTDLFYFILSRKRVITKSNVVDAMPY